VVGGISQLLLKGTVHRRYRNREIADIEFGWFKGRVTVLRTEPPGHGDVYVFAVNLYRKYTACLVAFEADLRRLNVTPEISSGGLVERISQRGIQFVCERDPALIPEPRQQDPSEHKRACAQTHLAL
jgi:hypothetical protein